MTNQTYNKRMRSSAVGARGSHPMKCNVENVTHAHVISPASGRAQGSLGWAWACKYFHVGVTWLGTYTCTFPDNSLIFCSSTATYYKSLLLIVHDCMT